MERDGDEWDRLARQLTSPDPAYGHQIRIRLHPFAGDSVDELASALRHAYESGRYDQVVGFNNNPGGAGGSETS